jgi:hypothetical protein
VVPLAGLGTASLLGGLASAAGLQVGQSVAAEGSQAQELAVDSAVAAVSSGLSALAWRLGRRAVARFEGAPQRLLAGLVLALLVGLLGAVVTAATPVPCRAGLRRRPTKQPSWPPWWGLTVRPARRIRRAAASAPGGTATVDDVLLGTRPGSVERTRAGGGTMSRRTTSASALAELTVSEERLRVDSEREQIGSARAVKHVDVEHATTRVERGTEHADLERAVVDDIDATAARSRRCRTAASPSPSSRSSSSSPSAWSCASGSSSASTRSTRSRWSAPSCAASASRSRRSGDVVVEDPARDRYAGVRDGLTGADPHA